MTNIELGLDGRERLVGQGRPRFFHDVDPGLLDVPLELDARRLENAPRGLGQLRPGTVPGNRG